MTKKELKKEINNCYKLAHNVNKQFAYSELKEKYLKFMGFTKFYFTTKTTKKELEMILLSSHFALDDLGIGHSYNA